MRHTPSQSSRAYGRMSIVSGSQTLPIYSRVTAGVQQDEIYLIVSGRGVLLHDGARDAFGPGDLLFVAAGTEHRFEDFTDDLVVWVVFFGAPGGEIPV